MFVDTDLYELYLLKNFVEQVKEFYNLGSISLGGRTLSFTP